MPSRAPARTRTPGRQVAAGCRASPRVPASALSADPRYSRGFDPRSADVSSNPSRRPRSCTWPIHRRAPLRLTVCPEGPPLARVPGTQLWAKDRGARRAALTVWWEDRKRSAGWCCESIQQVVPICRGRRASNFHKKPRVPGWRTAEQTHFVGREWDSLEETGRSVGLVCTELGGKEVPL